MSTKTSLEFQIVWYIYRNGGVVYFKTLEKKFGRPTARNKVRTLRDEGYVVKTTEANRVLLTEGWEYDG